MGIRCNQSNEMIKEYLNHLMQHETDNFSDSNTSKIYKALTSWKQI